MDRCSPTRGVTWGSVSAHKRKGPREKGRGRSSVEIKGQPPKSGVGSQKQQIPSLLSGHTSWEGFSVSLIEGPFLLEPHHPGTPRLLEKADSGLILSTSSS